MAKQARMPGIRPSLRQGPEKKKPPCPSCQAELGMVLYAPSNGRKPRIYYWCDVCRKAFKRGSLDESPAA